MNDLFENKDLRNLKVLYLRKCSNLGITEIVGPLNDFKDNFYLRNQYMNLEVLDLTGSKKYKQHFLKSRRFFETTILIGVLKS